ncbi:MAG: GAF domain-containing protein [Limisphaerales bacterium]
MNSGTIMEKDIVGEIRNKARSLSKGKLLEEVVTLLKNNFPKYSWVGIYLMDGADELVLGPFLGKPSPHTRIKIDSGICGAAAWEKDTIIVPDVSVDPRYLACLIETQSEIVVPIMREGQVFGEIDIDSDMPDAFDSADQKLLEEVAEILAEKF